MLRRGFTNTYFGLWVDLWVSSYLGRVHDTRKLQLDIFCKFVFLGVVFGIWGDEGGKMGETLTSSSG